MRGLRLWPDCAIVQRRSFTSLAFLHHGRSSTGGTTAAAAAVLSILLRSYRAVAKSNGPVLLAGPSGTSLVLESASIHRLEQFYFRKTHRRCAVMAMSAKLVPNRTLQFTIPRLLYVAHLRAAGRIKLHGCRDNPARLFVPRLLDAILTQ